MARPDARSPLRALVPMSAAAIAAVAACAAPPSRASTAMAPPAGRVLVFIDSVGVATGPDSAMAPILVYATGPARVGIDGRAPTPLADTLRLDRLPAMTIDVTDADVHIVYTGRGSITVGGPVIGGPATRIGASGNHIVLQKGGTGVGPR